jgi:hypothetical protein
VKTVSILLSIVLLVGCAATPVKREFPKVPQELMVECPDLKEVAEGTTKLSEVVTTVTVNYGQYHECRLISDAWRDWYKTQKEIFNSVK